jgi:hypothetical protein
LDENGKESATRSTVLYSSTYHTTNYIGGFGMTLTVLDNILTFTIQIPYLIVIAIIIVLYMLYSKRK